MWVSNLILHPAYDNACSVKRYRHAWRPSDMMESIRRVVEQGFLTYDGRLDWRWMTDDVPTRGADGDDASASRGSSDDDDASPSRGDCSGRRYAPTVITRQPLLGANNALHVCRGPARPFLETPPTLHSLLPLNVSTDATNRNTQRTSRSPRTLAPRAYRGCSAIPARSRAARSSSSTCSRKTSTKAYFTLARSRPRSYAWSTTRSSTCRYGSA